MIGPKRITRSSSSAVTIVKHKTRNVRSVHFLTGVGKGRSVREKDWSTVKHQWKLTDEHVAVLFSRWDELSAALHDRHAERAEGTGELMDEAIALYEELSTLCDGVIEPINQEERLSFVRANRGRFTAYRQLVMLFKEFQKQLAAKRIRSEFEKTDIVRNAATKDDA